MNTFFINHWEYVFLKQVNKKQRLFALNSCLASQKSKTLVVAILELSGSLRYIPYEKNDKTSPSQMVRPFPSHT